MVRRAIFASMLLMLTLNARSFAQYDVKVEIKDCKDSMLILGHYYLGKTYAMDTAYNKKGKFVFRSKERNLESGIYFFSTMKGKYCEFMVDKEKSFTIKTKDSDWTYSTEAKGSKTAQVYFDYMRGNRRLNEMGAQLEKEKNSISKDEYATRLKDLQLYGDSIKNAFMLLHPEHLLSKVLKATKPIEIPDFDVPVSPEGTPDSAAWQAKRWYYYKQHFFDNIDLSCSGLLRTPEPVFHRSYEYFWNEIMKYEPADSIIYYASLVIDKAQGAKAMSRFLIHNITERYLQSGIMNHDKVYVEMVKRYIKSGKADWLSPSAIDSETERAEKWENLLIGKRVPDLACPDTNGDWHNLYGLKNKYKILIFWSPDCGHCTKEVPKYHDFYIQNREKYDLEVMAINTENDTAHWKRFISEKELQWLNLNGLTANFDWREYFDVVKTPVVFILDEKNTIIAKNVQGDNIATIMELLESGKLKF